MVMQVAEAAMFASGIVETLDQWCAKLGAANVVAGAGNVANVPLPKVEKTGAPEDSGFRPDTLTKVSLVDVYGALGRVSYDLPRPSRLVLLSQEALETGGGRSCHNFNLGNAKHVHGDGHKWTMFRCSEIIGGKEVFFDPPNPQTWFRAFDTLDEGATDYLGLLRHRFAVAWPAVQRGDVRGFGHALKIAGYYTANETAYCNELARWYAILAAQMPE